MYIQLAGNANSCSIKIGIAVIAAVVGDLHPNVRCGVKSIHPAIAHVLAACAKIGPPSLRVQHAGQTDAAGVDGGIPGNVPVVDVHTLTGLGAHTYPGVVQIVHRVVL